MFPAMFPYEALKKIVSYLRQEPNRDLRSAAEACYDILGYAAGQIIPGAPQVFGASHIPNTNAEKANALEHLTLSRASGDAKIVIPPWLLDTLFTLLRKWLLGG